jgi:hypothetical protein
MSSIPSPEAAKAVVRRNTEEVQSKGDFDVFEELFADDFIDHTPQPSTTPDKAGVRKLYTYIRAAFPDFRAEIHWQLVDGDRVTTYKTYHGTQDKSPAKHSTPSGSSQTRPSATSMWDSEQERRSSSGQLTLPRPRTCSHKSSMA